MDKIEALFFNGADVCDIRKRYFGLHFNNGKLKSFKEKLEAILEVNEKALECFPFKILRISEIVINTHKVEG